MNPAILVTVLYEDSRSQTKGFGLHDLVVACVEDALGLARYALKRRIEGIPKRGNGKLLRACREDIGALPGRCVIAVFDDDRVRGLLQLPAGADRQAVEEAIRRGCCAPHRLSIVLLERNLESVIAAALACDPAIDADLAARAAGKSPNERDILFQRLAYNQDKRPVRECMRRRLPSFNELVETVLHFASGA